MKHYLKALKQKNSLLFSVGIVMLLVRRDPRTAGDAGGCTHGL